MLAYIKGGVGATQNEYIYVVLLDNRTSSFGSGVNFPSKQAALAQLKADYPAVVMSKEADILVEMKRRDAVYQEEWATFQAENRYSAKWRPTYARRTYEVTR